MSTIVKRFPIRNAALILGFSILAFLVILEPIVSFLLGALALLGILTTLFFKLIGAPHFPFWTRLAISISFVALLAVYEALIKLFSKPMV